MPGRKEVPGENLGEPPRSGELSARTVAAATKRDEGLISRSAPSGADIVDEEISSKAVFHPTLQSYKEVNFAIDCSCG